MHFVDVVRVGGDGEDADELVDGEDLVGVAEAIEDEAGIGPGEGHDFGEEALVDEGDVGAALELFVDPADLHEGPWDDEGRLQWRSCLSWGLTSLVMSKRSSILRRWAGRLLMAPASSALGLEETLPMLGVGWGILF